MTRPKKQKTPPGKWNDPNVPRDGWECVDFHDNGPDEDDRCTCEMCEKQSIRYVHVLAHPAYGHQLACGCVCAGKMTGDTEAARLREGRAKRRALAYHNWLELPGWANDAEGRTFIEERGWRVWVLKVSQGYAARIERTRRPWQFCTLPACSDAEDAAVAAYDALPMVKARYA